MVLCSLEKAAVVVRFEDGNENNLYIAKWKQQRFRFGLH